MLEWVKRSVCVCVCAPGEEEEGWRWWGVRVTQSPPGEAAMLGVTPQVSGHPLLLP